MIIIWFNIKGIHWLKYKILEASNKAVASVLRTNDGRLSQGNNNGEVRVGQIKGIHKL